MPHRAWVCLALLLLPRPAWAQDSVIATRIGHHALAQPRLDESSGLTASGAFPGVLWTLNDSGNRAELFAIDTTGRDLGVVRVEGAENTDWEAIARARCGAGSCLYLADVGDNLRRRSSVRIYRVPEPDPARVQRTRPNATLEVRCADGPKNVEAIFVTDEEDVYLFTKTNQVPALYRVPGSAWRTGRATANRVQSLPIPPAPGYAFLITDAAFDSERNLVAVRTYGHLFFFRLAQGELVPDPSRPRCDLPGFEPQGEGVTWIQGDTLATTSERVMLLPGSVSRIVCPSSR